MPAAPHWPMLTLLAVAAGGLLRRRAAGTDLVAATVVPRQSTEQMLAAEASEAVVSSYAYHGCSDREIADRFGLSEADVRGAFAAVLARSRALRAFALRKAQTELATAKGNGPMLTWLGRNELGQSLAPAAGGEPEPDLPAEA